MLSRIKTAVSFIALTSCLIFASVLAAKEAGATAPASTATSAGGIPIKGKTADGKYMVYDLDGELNDVNYSSPGKIWQPADLEKRLNYVAKEDVKAGTYECDFVCKDKKGQIVGLAMWVKEMNEKQAAGKKK